MTFPPPALCVRFLVELILLSALHSSFLFSILLSPPPGCKRNYNKNKHSQQWVLSLPCENGCPRTGSVTERSTEASDFQSGGKSSFRFILLRAQRYLESQKSLSQREHPSATFLWWHESLSSWPSCPRPLECSSRWPSWFSAERSIPVFCFQFLLFPLQAEIKIKDWRQSISWKDVVID